MSQKSPETVLPTQAFDALFRSEPLEERLEFGTPCPPGTTYSPDTSGCVPVGGPPGVTVTPEPATMAMAAAGLGGLGVAQYLRKRKNRQQADASTNETKQD